MLYIVKKTIDQIVEQGNHFIIQVKGNTPKLKSHLLDEIAQHDNKLGSIQTVDKQRGRIDNRNYQVYSINTDGLPKGWNHINTAIVVNRHGVRNRKSYENIALYISDITETASFFSKSIRQHWSIENNLHRQKDVYQNEDNNQIKDHKIAIITSLLQTMVLNLFQTHGYRSIMKANEKYANRVLASFELINNRLYIDKFRTV